MQVKQRWVAGLITAALITGLTACSPTSSTPNPSPTISLKPHGWTQIVNQNFTKDAAIGQFGDVYGNDLRGYSGHGDTSGHAMYEPDKVLSVQNGYLDWYVHSENGQPMTAAPLPQGYNGQLYGKWTIRFQSDLIPGYKLAFLLWPDSDKWTDGEIDFPEGELGGDISGFSHDVTGTPSNNVFKFDTGETMTGWHTLTIEKMPDHLTYTIDGVSKTTTDMKALPTKPMHEVLQVESDLSPAPAPSTTVSGHVQVDWVRIWHYNP